MLTGYTIDKGQPINRYFSSLIKNGYKLPSQISDDCKKIVDCSLKINPQERFKTTELLDLVSNYFEKRNQKNILHSFSTADVSHVSSPHNPSS